MNQQITKEELMMDKLCHFYRKHPDAILTLDTVLNKKSLITLRVLDWFVTTYCKTISKSTYYIFKNYKLRLKSYSKKLFDPFCRGERIVMLIGNNRKLETTAGQLNFFKWIIEDEIIRIYNENINNVNSSMLREGFKIKLTGRGRKKKLIYSDSIGTFSDGELSETPTESESI